MFQATAGRLVRLAFRVKVVGPALPAGPCVLVANHTSFLDPILLGAVFARRISFLTSAAICAAPGLGWFFRWSRSIPVDDHGPNRVALRRARAVLAAGDVLGVFPEGGISRDGKLLRGNPGAVALALAGGAPIVPVGLIGAAAALPPESRWPRLARVEVHVGPAIEVCEVGADDRRQRVRHATLRVMDAIAALTGQESREAVLARIRRSIS